MHAIGQGFESPHLQKDESVGVSGTSPDEAGPRMRPTDWHFEFFDRIRKKQRRRIGAHGRGYVGESGEPDKQ